MTTRAIPREEWWREYARWQLGEREGPLCVECAAAIPREAIAGGVAIGLLCDECRAEGGQ